MDGQIQLPTHTTPVMVAPKGKTMSRKSRLAIFIGEQDGGPVFMYCGTGGRLEPNQVERYEVIKEVTDAHRKKAKYGLKYLKPRRITFAAICAKCGVTVNRFRRLLELSPLTKKDFCQRADISVASYGDIVRGRQCGGIIEGSKRESKVIAAIKSVVSVNNEIQLGTVLSGHDCSVEGFISDDTTVTKFALLYGYDNDTREFLVALIEAVKAHGTDIWVKPDRLAELNDYLKYVTMLK